jgi:hypothetical protein
LAWQPSSMSYNPDLTMKSLTFLVSIFLLAGCQSKSKGPPGKSLSDISKYIFPKPIDSSLLVKDETVFVGVPGFDSTTYSRTEFNKIVVQFPELYCSPTVDPDIAYYGSVFSDEISKGIEFNSEAGQDEFYILYAFFLRRKDAARSLVGSRDTLTRIFEEINGIFGELNHGGTFFGHQSFRIIGYAEYCIYLLSQQPEEFKKEYPVKAQKANFIDQLRQQISDEISVDNNLIGKYEKEGRQREMLSSVAKINGLISNYFYLKQARRFTYDYYDVY